ncbi:MAG: glycoside hydrolase domain-containing protein [Planctomycetota bacterium]
MKRFYRVKAKGLVALAVLLVFSGNGSMVVWGAGAAPAPVAETGQTILGGGGYFRAFAMWRDSGTGILKGLKSAPPSEGWIQPDFDDQNWYRSAGPLTGEDVFSHGANEPRLAFCGLLCLRGKFRVEKPGSVTGLDLSLKFRGGAVVYLNGKEVARGEMPDGATAPEAPGKPYSDENYTAGTLERSLGPVRVPVSQLRQGVNVLAIEIHGSDFTAAKSVASGSKKARETSLAGLCGLKLSAAGSGIVPNVDRPAGFRVFNIDSHQVFTIMEYGDPCEPVKPIRLGGARNGSYSGAVVASSTAAIDGLKAVVSDLAQAGGTARIPAASVEIRYGTPADRDHVGKVGLAKETYRWTIPPSFSGLDREPPGSVVPGGLPVDSAERVELGLPAKPTPGAVVPVWVTVNVPKTIPAGKYAGSLTITATGAPETKVPVEVEVVEWTIPDVKKTFVGIYQSPESLASMYKVPLWSDAHWKLMEESFNLMGKAYNNLLMLPLLEKSQTGNEESLIFWMKQPDGSFTFDYANFDRMLGLATRYCTLRVVVAQLTHGPYMAEWGTTKLKNPEGAESVFSGIRSVTLKDASGKLSSMRLMDYGTPESKAALKTLTDGIRGKLKAKGIEGSLTFGTNQDTGMDKETADFFKDIQPQVKWHYAAHGCRTIPLYAYVEYLYVDNWLPESLEKRRDRKADPGTIIVMSQRISCAGQPISVFRTMMERAGILGDNGAGRMGMDYWSFPKGQGGSGWSGTYLGRWPNSTPGQRCPHVGAIALPGKNGPISSSKLEALREGVQENEALVFMREALEGGKISGELADRVRAFQEARFQYCRMIHGSVAEPRAACDGGRFARSMALYRLVAEVAGK